MMKYKPQLSLLAGSWGGLNPYRLQFGNLKQGGSEAVDPLLRLGAEFNKWLSGEYGLTMSWSAHLNSEVKVHDGHPAAQYNSPLAIDLDRWIEGSLAGTHAPVGRIIPKGFGYDWSDLGAFRNNDPQVRQFHHDGMVLSFRYSEKVRQAKAGPGKVIYWDGPDSLDWQRVLTGHDIWLSYGSVPTLVEWKRLVAGVGDALLEAVESGLTAQGSELLVEPKGGGDPGYLGILMDSVLTLQAIGDINKAAGVESAPVAWYQPEGAHVRGEGERLSAALERARKLGMWNGQVHMNCSPLAKVPFSRLLGAQPNGTLMSEFTPATDPDFNVWPCAIAEWVDDNREAIRQGVIFSGETGKPFEIEFDSHICRGHVRAATPEARDKATIDNLKAMCGWTIKTFNELAEEEQKAAA